MELEAILKLENETNSYSRYDFIVNNIWLSIPYLTFSSFFSFVGTIGNFLVFGTLLKIKVRNQQLHNSGTTNS